MFIVTHTGKCGGLRGWGSQPGLSTGRLWQALALVTSSSPGTGAPLVQGSRNQRGQWAPAPYHGWHGGGRRVDLALRGFLWPATLNPAWRPDLEPSISHSSFLSPKPPPNTLKNMALCSKEPVSSGQETPIRGQATPGAGRSGQVHGPDDQAEKSWWTVPCPTEICLTFMDLPGH